MRGIALLLVSFFHVHNIDCCLLFGDLHRFEDGDELGSIEDAYIFKREDYLLTGQAKWLGVKNVVDEDSHDLWANLVGYYTANIDGEEQHFTFLSG